jgi:D-aminopeptidase
VFAAIRNAHGGPVEEGTVGSGTGTVAFGFKGGIGTASRRFPQGAGSYTLGVLVQTNYGGNLTIAGAPVGLELRRERGGSSADGSVIVVIATDAPVDARNLRRLAARSMMGLGRTGSAASNGSGDYAIAFSTAPELRTRPGARAGGSVVSNDSMSPLFEAVIEATEEAVYNSLFRATTVSARGITVEALPLERTIEILRRHGAVRGR